MRLGKLFICGVIFFVGIGMIIGPVWCRNRNPCQSSVVALCLISFYIYFYCFHKNRRSCDGEKESVNR